MSDTVIVNVRADCIDTLQLHVNAARIRCIVV